MKNHKPIIYYEEISTRAEDQLSDFLEDLEIFLKRSEDGIGPKFLALFALSMGI
jgi:hypothetical protein